MYRSCIFCSATLGSNDSIERFPVGRSVAFDAAKGRLWAVCGNCARWNLAPIEERWEAIEDAERLFRDTRVRVQRENIGLARLRDGSRLIRVGDALQGELAAWRYGDRIMLRGAPTGWGRLWAVCGRCARWNLAPIEERWEAIEDAERLFRDTRVRVQRENVGLAKLRDGSRLVRIGQIVPGELAAVRYRKPYRRRHALNMAVRVAAGTAGLVSAAAVSPAIALAPIAALPVAGWWLAREMIATAEFDPRMRVRLEEIRTRGRRLVRFPVSARVLDWVGAEKPGGAIPLTRLHLFGARLMPSADGHFAVQLPALDLCVDGWHAQALTARRLVHLTRAGGDERDLAASVKIIGNLGGAAAYLERAARQGMQIGPDAAHYGVQALALEMALHEETERRALEGELAMLEAMWREAEQIADIADRLPDLPAPEPPRLDAGS